MVVSGQAIAARRRWMTSQRSARVIRERTFGVMRITTKAFVAGAVIERGIVVDAAPILWHTLGWDMARLARHYRRRGAEVMMIERGPAQLPAQERW